MKFHDDRGRSSTVNLRFFGMGGQRHFLFILSHSIFCIQVAVLHSVLKFVDDRRIFTVFAAVVRFQDDGRHIGFWRFETCYL